MEDAFIERRILTGKNKILSSIIIMKPIKNENGTSYCKVIFQLADKYNSNINGLDDFNAVQCALSYVNAVCLNSEDPEFFWPGGESMKVHDI